MTANTNDCEMQRKLESMGVTYGNLEGQYFTQWRIDILNDLICHVVYLYGDTPKVQVSDVHIWYDAEHDFHRLSYKAAGNEIEVQFYKVFSSKINGVDGWRGCPRYCQSDFARHLRDHSRLAVQAESSVEQ